MYPLRCTKKLLDRMRVAPEPNPPTATTILGEWYANLVYVGNRQLMLCVCDKTLLPVIVPAVHAKPLPYRLPEALFDVLKALVEPHRSRDARDAACGGRPNGQSQRHRHADRLRPGPPLRSRRRVADSRRVVAARDAVQADRHEQPKRETKVVPPEGFTCPLTDNTR